MRTVQLHTTSCDITGIIITRVRKRNSQPTRPLPPNTAAILKRLATATSEWQAGRAAPSLRATTRTCTLPHNTRPLPLPTAGRSAQGAHRTQYMLPSNHALGLCKPEQAAKYCKVFFHQNVTTH